MVLQVQLEPNDDAGDAHFDGTTGTAEGTVNIPLVLAVRQDANHKLVRRCSDKNVYE